MATSLASWCRLPGTPRSANLALPLDLLHSRSSLPNARQQKIQELRHGACPHATL
eukprot:CAMPEP_0115313746 /NCGR_PEP_ID=MMETSP0270-20121206/76641_1 /TAXON_ID=71861 /ORGANISM="Scrippsiella trochoidea, Strain CCMP3099" /LENGTH=54 /DNA_ID=CAMNT_0002732881 /DNA_START=120 /DNA_END=284 /DNA_ORIENTATION=-